MERSFAHLLRTSRLATFDKSIPQIYTTTQTAKAIGDWGLKRNLPTVLKTHFVNIEDLDTAEHQTPFTSAASDYLFLQRWKENFPSSRPPAPQPLVVKKDLAAMTDAEFKKLLRTAREKRQAWKDALANGEVRSDEHLSFLDITSRSPNATSFDSGSSQGAFGSTRSPGSTAYAASSTRPKVGPTYGFYVPTTPVIVQGRIFGRGRTTSSQYIGVCGVVATLPSAPAHLQNVSKSLQPYYVAKAEFGPDGRPDVVLSLTPPSPEPTNWSPGTIGSRSSTYVSSRLSQGAAAKEPLDANVKDKVISRVQVLLEERDKAATRQ
ncbi:mitochondrial ribosomal protein subunit-domain-containing protein [Mortierella sp. GBAus27b]|nr:mitochondrial ribosomal protein subunit-domain-containing protein [Mortierella sp. GBAus27b]